MLHGEAVPAHHGSGRSTCTIQLASSTRPSCSNRERPGLEVLDELRVQCARSIAALRALDDKGWEKVGWSPEGERPYHRFQETRVVDSWIHLQDIRDALLQPEDDHGRRRDRREPLRVGAAYIVGKRMKSPDGTLVRVNLSGRLARSVLIGVVDGRALASTTARTRRRSNHDAGRPLLASRAGRISAAAFLAASATDVRGIA